MTPLTRPRGPLPARVYWTRRLLVVGVAILLVLGIARILGGGSDGASDENVAAQASADQTSSSASPGAVAAGSPGVTPAGGKSSKKPRKPVLAEPDGPCADDDIMVTPTVTSAVAGGDTEIKLKLSTLTSEACTWRAGPDSLTLKVTSGRDEIWTSRQCPAAVPTSDVIVRRAVTTKVDVIWPSRRFDDSCTRVIEWSLPGWYHVEAAALSGEPADAQFELAAPERPVVNRTVKPKPDRKTPGSKTTSRAEPQQQPSDAPSGAVEPNG